MHTLSAISENFNSLMMILREKRELRKELVAFFTGLETIWKGLPAELDQKSKLSLLAKIIDKGTAEISHSLEVLDKQIDSLIEGYGASVQALKMQLDNAVRISGALQREKDHIISKQNSVIDDFDKSLKKCQADLEILTESRSEKNKKIANLETTLINQNERIEKCQADLDRNISQNRNLIHDIEKAHKFGVLCIAEWGLFADNKKKIVSLVEQIKEILSGVDE